MSAENGICASDRCTDKPTFLYGIMIARIAGEDDGEQGIAVGIRASAIAHHLCHHIGLCPTRELAEKLASGELEKELDGGPFNEDYTPTEE